MEVDEAEEVGRLRVDWRGAARCRHDDPEALFVRGAAQRDAREVCRACPVRTECLAHALDNRVRWGVWGGMTERDRRALLKRRPDVVSWSALLESARVEAVRRHLEELDRRRLTADPADRPDPAAGSRAAG